MWMNGRSYSIRATSAMKGDVEEKGGASCLGIWNPHRYVIEG